MVALLGRIYYNAVFGGLGGLLGWMLFGVFGDKNPTEETRWSQDLLLGIIVGGLIAYLVVSVEAIRDRSLARFARLSTYGVLLGALGGGLGALLGDGIKDFLTYRFNIENGLLQIVLSMLGFGIGWTFLGVAVGTSEGIAARSLGKFSYGTIGGALGGMFGGALYGLFAEATKQSESANTYFWGALGLVIMGACIGSLTALVKGVFQPASVKVLRGWQEGREYPLDKVANLLGRDEHADIALFRDMKVEKKHAYIRRLGKRFVLFNNSAPPEHTLVNDVRVPHVMELKDGDRIQLGNVILRFQARAAVNRPRPQRRPLPAVTPASSAVVAQVLKQ